MNGPQLTPVNSAAVTPQPGAKTSPEFSTVLDQQLKFSRHAAMRMEQRHQSLSPAEWQQLGEATEAARKSGAKQAAIVMPNAIYIVAPPSRTVVTAIDHSEHPMQVISQVDALVLVGRTDGRHPEAPPSRPIDGVAATPIHWSLITEHNT